MSEVTAQPVAASTPEATKEPIKEGAAAPVVTEPAKAVAEPTKVEAPKAESETPQPVKPVVPEKYDLKLPEGSLLKASAIENVSSFAKEKGLSNEAAQAILERENQQEAERVSSLQTQLKQQSEAWKAEALNDPRMGGELFAKQNVELAHRALKFFGSEKLMDDLEKAGVGNYPELLVAWNKVGKMMGEDKLIVQGAQSQKQSSSLQDVFYPEMAKKE